MNEEKRKIKKQKLLVWVFVLLIGIVLAVLGAVLTDNFDKSDYDYISVRITHIETRFAGWSDGDAQYDHYVFVEYEYGGVLYSDVELNAYDIGMYEGKEIQVYCNKNNPEKLVTKGETIIYIVMIALGGVLATVSVIMLVRTLQKPDNADNRDKGIGWDI